MGLFKRKPKENLDEKFKSLYKEINKIAADAGSELDFTVKYSQLVLASNKYDELLKLIDKGANFDKDHFKSLKETIDAEAKKIKGLIDED